MKRFLCALLSILTAFGVFAFSGCIGGKNSDSSPEASVPPTSSDSVPEEEPIPEADAEMSAKVMSVNIAYPTKFASSYIQYKGQTPDDYTMKKRFNRLCSLVSYYTPDIIMMQEVNGRGGWWNYLVEGEDTFLERYDKYDFVGTTNLAGGTNGSGGDNILYNQVYYNTNKFELVAGGTFFCRDDKTSPENSYTGDYEGEYSQSNTTTCSWAVLRDKKTNVTAVYASTHLCTRPNGAQCFRNYGQARNATEGLYAIAEQYKWGDKALPIVLSGDFNGDPSHNNFFSYAHMTENAHYTDSKLVAPVEDNSGTARVFGKDIANNGIRIDYIFQQGAEVSDYKVLKGTFAEDKNQTYCEYNTEAVLDGTQYDLTDHLPVYAKLKFNGKSSSVAPNDYVNPEVLDDETISAKTEINATSTKIVFDSPELLDFVGKNENKGFQADIVFDGKTIDFCLRLMTPKSRIDPTISIDYSALMKHLGLSVAKADEYKKIKVEYRYVSTRVESALYFGASTTGMVPLTVAVNTVQVPVDNNNWTSKVFDFSSVNSAFWEDEFVYFGVTTGVGLMGGDAIYIRSIELIK